MYCDKSGTVSQDAGPPTARDLVTRRSGPLCASASEASKLSHLDRLRQLDGNDAKSVAAQCNVRMHSLVGWIMVLRGVLLLAFPDTFMSITNQTIGAETLWRIVFAGFTLVGLYLTYVGWFSRHKGSVAQAPGWIPDLPRAA